MCWGEGAGGEGLEWGMDIVSGELGGGLGLRGFLTFFWFWVLGLGVWILDAGGRRWR